MVMSEKVQKIMFIALIAVATLSLFFWGASFLLKKDAQRLKGYEREAMAIGLERLKEECLGEGKTRSVCDNIKVTVETSECRGQVCWLVNGRTDDEHGFGGGIIIGKQSGEYIVLYYVRNTGIN